MTATILLVATIASIACFTAMLLCWICDVWAPRIARNRAARRRRQQLARQDVADLARYRAVRRIGGGL